jgi:hypothetical protein
VSDPPADVVFVPARVKPKEPSGRIAWPSGIVQEKPRAAAGVQEAVLTTRSKCATVFGDPSTWKQRP